jgi:quercetin dioxygenase-like cupin family protein
MTQSARRYRWDDVPEDAPIPLLTRRIIEGDQVLVARIELGVGCTVARHSHPNEQISVVLSGRLRWLVDEDPGREVIVGPGEVLHLPANVAHGVEVLEDCVVLDLLSPPGAMGVDSQGGGA